MKKGEQRRAGSWRGMWEKRIFKREESRACLLAKVAMSWKERIDEE